MKFVESLQQKFFETICCMLFAISLSIDAHSCSILVLPYDNQSIVARNFDLPDVKDLAPNKDSFIVINLRGTQHSSLQLQDCHFTGLQNMAASQQI